MENGYFCLQFGGDFVFQDQYYIFTEREMIKLYNSTLKNLLGIIKDGDEKDRKFALDLIGGLIVRPMRLH
jgi:hypothetical protein